MTWAGRPIGHLRTVDCQSDLTVPDRARAAIDANRLAVLRQDVGVDPLNGHALLCQLKVAVALMALDSRNSLNDEDWDLAEHVMSVSERTREQCQNALRRHRRSQNTARALAADEHDEIVSDRKCQRAREAILRKLATGTELTSGELRRSLKDDIRSYFDAALTELLDRQEVYSSAAKRGNHNVHVYYRYTDEQQQVIRQNDSWTVGTRAPEQSPKQLLG